MTTKAQLVVSAVFMACMQQGCSSSPTVTAADIATAAAAVQAVATAVQNATAKQVEAAVTSINTVSASGWVRRPRQVAAISKSLAALQKELAAMPASGGDSLASVLEGRTYPPAVKTQLIALTAAYFAEMPERKAANGTRFNLGVSALKTVSDKLPAPPALSSAEAPAYFCARTIVERLAGLSTLTIDTATTATATGQLNTALCLGQ